MRAIFKDSELQKTYEKNGYVIVESFLDERDIRHLTDFYHNHDSDLNHGFHATLHSHLVDYRREVSNGINKVFTPKAEKYLERFKPTFSNYTVKEPDEDSGFDLHLDWTMVNEKQFVSITIWSPLIDISDNNGYLWVLKGSHQFEYTIRGGPGLKTSVAREYDEWQNRKYELEVIKLKAGSAMIYDHRLFHGSPPNKTNKPRLAINYTMIPAETESWHYHFRGDREVEIFEVDPDFYNRHILNTEPENVRSIGVEKIEPIFLTQEQVNNLAKK